MRNLPATTSIRAGDAVHLASAIEYGFDEIWTNDCHLLAAARDAGLRGSGLNYLSATERSASSPIIGREYASSWLALTSMKIHIISTRA